MGHFHIPYGNFIISNSLIISLNDGLFSGSLSQHRLVNLANTSGVFLGIVGLKSLFNTSKDTYNPVISINI